MSEIKIEKYERLLDLGIVFEFHYNDFKLLNHSGFCPGCDMDILDGAYVYVINKLKEAGLLDKDFKLKCCDCYARDQKRDKDKE